MQDVLVDFWAEIANENGELRSSVITAAIGKAATGSPIKFERAVRVWNWLTIKLKGLGGCCSGLEVDEAIASVRATEHVSESF